MAARDGETNFEAQGEDDNGHEAFGDEVPDAAPDPGAYMAGFRDGVMYTARASGYAPSDMADPKDRMARERAVAVQRAQRSAALALITVKDRLHEPIEAEIFSLAGVDPKADRASKRGWVRRVMQRGQGPVGS